MHSGPLEEALEWLDCGVSVFRLPPNQKAARNESWGQWRDGRPLQREVIAMFKRAGNLAIVTGPASGGLCVRDFDTVEAHERFRAAYPALAKSLPTVRTKRGFHVYFRITGEVLKRYGKMVKLIGRGKQKEGELILCHYVVAPPSIVKGFAYQWAISWSGWPPIIDPVDFGLDRPLAHSRHRHTEQTQAIRKGRKSKSDSVSLNAETSEPEIESDVNPSKRITAIEISELPPKLRTKVNRIIVDTMPSMEGERNRQVFELARALKAITQFADLPAKVFIGILREWHAKALPYIATKDFSTTWLDFVNAWGNVKFPLGENMHDAMQKARATPTPNCISHHDNPLIIDLVKLCRALSLQGGTFYLSCRLAGELLGAPYRTVNDWMRALEREGILQCVKKGIVGGTKASFFRYLGD